MWILGKPEREFVFLYLPALLSVVIAVIYPNFAIESVLYAVIATGIIDSGHVYTTLWRTYLHPEERVSHRGYIFLPMIFFSVFFLWFYTDIPYLWAFVVYATLYHHVRQIYGFSKWYQKLNGRMDKVSDFFLYLLSYSPMVIYHFRTDAFAGYYTESDLFLYPSQFMTTVLLVIYMVIYLAWMIYEAKLWRQGTHELNRIISVGFPALIYGYCFLLGETLTQVLFPLLFLHGIAYFGVMEQSLARTQKKFTGNRAFLVVVGTAIVAGIGESWIEGNVIEFRPGNEPFLRAFLVGLWLTPLFCHYAFDAIIWRKGHREAHLVFAPSKE